MSRQSFPRSSTTIGVVGPESEEADRGASGPESYQTVLSMLEECQLTEEDTELLLTDAYALNRRLREELARMDSADSGVGPRRNGAQLPPIKLSRGMGERQRSQLADMSRVYSSQSGKNSGGQRANRKKQPSSSNKRPLEKKEWQ